MTRVLVFKRGGIFAGYAMTGYLLLIPLLKKGVAFLPAMQ